MKVRGDLFLSAIVAASLAAPVIAAPAPGAGGPGGPGGGGGFQMSPEMQKLREQTKYHTQLGRMVGARTMQELEKDKGTAITPAQAKQLLGIIKPWQSKDKMTEDQAKELIKGVQKVYTPKQLTAIGKLPQRGFGGGGGRGGSGGGPGGPGGPGGGARQGGGPGGPGGAGGGARQGGGPGGAGGGRGGFNLEAMKSRNPFSTKPATDTSNPMASFGVARAKWLGDALAARAANKPIPAPPARPGGDGPGGGGANTARRG